MNIRIHKEGILTILIVLIILTIFNSVIYFAFSFIIIVFFIFLFLSVVFLCLIFWFFRNPRRTLIKDNQIIYSPADGKVVVIEKTIEKEFLKDERIQISIFMSPLNVHINRYPVSGEIDYVKYHKGKYLVAWHPKSSLKNERTTTVITTPSKVKILVRQIAGAVARRIVCYAKPGEKAEQGNQLGFIKFGSRVDIFLPSSAKILCTLNQKVKGNKTILAKFNQVF